MHLLPVYKFPLGGAISEHGRVRVDRASNIISVM